MSLKYLSAEKETLLPVATTAPASKSAEERAAKLETRLFYLCAAMLLMLFGSLFCRTSLSPLNPVALTLQHLDAGMLSSLWASLPAPALLFVAAPYFVEQSKVSQVRYWIYLLYLMGVAVGAVVFGSEASRIQRDLTMH